MSDYERVAKAISYIREHYREQPDLERIAREIHLSPYHFQRLFRKWAGVSPKKFLEYTSIERAKVLLKEQASLSEAGFEAGLSGTGRLHDLFIKIEGMTPGEFKNGGENLHINYSFSATPFGDIISASTAKGICHLMFADNERRALRRLRERFPNAVIEEKRDPVQRAATGIFEDDWSDLSKIRLHLKGTPFQIKVWEALLKVPFGRISSYTEIADSIGRPTALRAVGAAIGRNPVAYLIPCHRIIRSTGILGEYHWGDERKAAIIGWEAAKLESGLGPDDTL